MDYDMNSAFNAGTSISQNAITTNPYDMESAFALSPRNEYLQRVDTTQEKLKDVGFLPKALNFLMSSSPLNRMQATSEYLGALESGEITEFRPRDVKGGETVDEWKEATKEDRAAHEAEFDLWRLERFERESSKGVFHQIEGPMMLGVGHLALTAPKMAAAILGGFTIKDMLLPTGRELMDEHFPDTNPNVVDFIEVVEMGVFGAAFGAVGAGKVRPVKYWKNAKAVRMEAKQVRAVLENPKTTTAQKAKLLDDLHITYEQAQMAVNKNVPVMVEAEKVAQASKDPKFKEKMGIEEKVVKAPEKPQKKTTLSKVKKEEISSRYQEDIQRIEKAGMFDKKTAITESQMIDFERTGQLSHETPIKNIKSILEKGIEDPFGVLSHTSKAEFVTKDAAIVHITVPKESRGAVRLGMRADEIAVSQKIPVEWIDKIVDAKTGKALYSKAVGSELRPEGVKGTGDLKTRKVSQSIEEQAIEKGLVEDLGELPSYRQRNMKDVANRANEIIKKDPALAEKIAFGEAKEINDVRAQEMFTALRAKAIAEGDVTQIHKLATNEKATAMTTELGQRVKALDSGEKGTDPVKIIQDVAKTRKEATESKIGQRKVKKQVKELKAEVKKTQPKAKDWEGFIRSLEC